MYWQFSSDRRLLNVKLSDLIQEPVVIEVGDFHGKTAKDFCNDLQNACLTGQPFVPVIIDSYGGEIYSLLRIIDAIKNCPLPVATIAMGKAMSSGADLLAAGTPGWRFASPLATIMVHESSSHLPDQKLTDLENEVAETKRLNSLAFELLDKHCKQEFGYFEKKLKDRDRTDWIMTATDALREGIVDHVAIPTLKINVSVDIKLDI